MSRLTELINIDGMEIKVSKERPLSDQGLGAILHKLYVLEELEQDLGCPLEVFAKILLYPKIRTRFGIREIDKIDYYVEDDNRGLMIYFKNGTFDKLSNYKKTWWLSKTKEE